MYIKQTMFSKPYRYMIHSSTYFLPFTLSDKMKYAETSPVFLKNTEKGKG